MGPKYTLDRYMDPIENPAQRRLTNHGISISRDGGGNWTDVSGTLELFWLLEQLGERFSPNCLGLFCSFFCLAGFCFLVILQLCIVTLGRVLNSLSGIFRALHSHVVSYPLPDIVAVKGSMTGGIPGLRPNAKPQSLNSKLRHSKPYKNST